MINLRTKFEVVHLFQI